MKEQIEELKRKSDKIDDLIKKRIVDETDGKKTVILDGIVNIEEYCKVKYKILWIMKEANDTDGGGWDMREFMGDKKELCNYNLWRKTYEPIIYSAYSILNGFPKWNDIPDTAEKPEMIDVLRNIAFINLKKIPGSSVSDHNTIGEAYKKDKDIIKLQIDAYNPDIIICGNTFTFLSPDLDIPEYKMINSGDSATYYIKNDRIYISAYHPNQRMHGQEQYCNDIINAVEQWVKSRGKN